MKAKDFTVGVICGVLICGAVPSVFAAVGSKTMEAVYNDIKIYIDQELITPKDANDRYVEPFISDGTTYLPVRAVAEALGQEVGWDAATKSVYIGTQPDQLSAQSPQTVPAGNVLTVPNNGDKRFVPKDGDRILCDGGSIYEIVKGPDLNAWTSFTANGKWHPEEALPEPTCDWSVYPELQLPDVLVNRWNDESGDDLYILNLHEMRRMQYTLYNYIYPETVRYYGEHPGLLEAIRRNGYDPAIEKHIGQVRFGDLPHQTKQGFYPWDEREITKQVKNTPTSLFCVEAWDIYHNGNYLRTEYKLQMRQAEIVE
jgi:hypothetical protein